MSEDNGHGLHNYALCSNYLTVSSLVAVLPDPEAPMMPQANGTYFLLGSNLSGWASDDDQYTTAGGQPAVGDLTQRLVRLPRWRRPSAALAAMRGPGNHRAVPGTPVEYASIARAADGDYEEDETVTVLAGGRSSRG